MSVFIGSVKGPHHNSTTEAGEVWSDGGGVSLRVFEARVFEVAGTAKEGVDCRLDPVAARNLAALLVRASEEAERMRARSEPEPG